MSAPWQSPTLPTIDVVIPAHNNADTIDETLQSVLNQVYQPQKIIVVTNGCQDQTAEIVKTYQQKHDDKIILIDVSEKIGASRARNLGFAKVTSQYVAFLDADDYWYPLWLKTAMEKAVQRPDVGAFFCNPYIRMGCQKNKTYLREPRRLPYGAVNGENVFTELWRECFCLPTGVILQSKIVSEVGLYDEHYRIANDWEFHLRVASQYKFLYIEGKHAVYCVREGSLVHNPATLLERIWVDLELRHRWFPEILLAYQRQEQQQDLQKFLAITYYNSFLYYASKFIKYGKMREAKRCLYASLLLMQQNIYSPDGMRAFLVISGLSMTFLPTIWANHAVHYKSLYQQYAQHMRSSMNL